MSDILYHLSPIFLAFKSKHEVCINTRTYTYVLTMFKVFHNSFSNTQPSFGLIPDDFLTLWSFQRQINRNKQSLKSRDAKKL